MRQNNKQQQISDESNPLKLTEIQQFSMNQKVLELQVQLHNSEKHYQCVKKPIKCFQKLKKLLHDAKSPQIPSQLGLSSSKIISQNLDNDHRINEKTSDFQKVKLKNVYEVYKQALEQKHKKRMREFERSVLKINTTKVEENQSVGHQLIYERQDEIKKRLNNKKIDPSIISHLQTLSTSNKQPSIIKKFNPKKNTSYLLETFQEPQQHFLNSLHRKSNEKKFPAQYYDYLLPPNNQGGFYQVKRRCYTELREFDDQESKYNDYNKTRNISFKLPIEKVKTKKPFIEKVGGITYNLPQVVDKLNVHDSNTTISYLVKSLRKPSKSQNSNKERQHISPLQDFRKASQSVVKYRKKSFYKKYHTQSIENTEQMLAEGQLQQDFDPNKYSISSQRNNSQKQASKDTYKKLGNKRAKCKLNSMNEIEGWNIESQNHQVENNLFEVNHMG